MECPAGAVGNIGTGLFTGRFAICMLTRFQTSCHAETVDGGSNRIHPTMSLAVKESTGRCRTIK